MPSSRRASPESRSWIQSESGIPVLDPERIRNPGLGSSGLVLSLVEAASLGGRQQRRRRSLGWRTCTLRGNQRRGYGHASFVVQQPSAHRHRHHLHSEKSTHRLPWGHWFPSTTTISIRSHGMRWDIRHCACDYEGIVLRCLPHTVVPRSQPLNTEQPSHAGRQRSYTAKLRHI